MRERVKERERSAACIAPDSLATYLHHLGRLSALSRLFSFSMEYKDYGSIQSTDMRRTICVEASLKAAVLPSRSLPNCGLENLHDDVFDAILGMLLSDPTNDAIKNLSCLSRGLRNLCLPVLFHDCVITTHTTYNRYLPPAYARPYIRCVLRSTSN